jgi:hypothetical protein
LSLRFTLSLRLFQYLLIHNNHLNSDERAITMRVKLRLRVLRGAHEIC